MKAAVFHGVHQPLTVEEIEADEPADYEVLVRTGAAGVCHSELHMVEGHSPVPPPAVLGHESAGVVEQVGKRVTYVQPGDHVIARGTFCGHCEMCLTGHLNVCTNRPGRTASDPPTLSWKGERLNQWGSNIFGWAEQMLLHENGVVKISKEMPLDAAALLGCAVITGFGAVMRTAEVEPGSSIAVFGCGGIGLSTIQGGVISGCQRVIAVDLLDSKLEVAREFGATHTVNASKEDPVEAIRAIADGQGVHYSFDAIGLASVALQALDSPAAAGRGDADRRDPGGSARLLQLAAAGRREEDPGLRDGLEPFSHGPADAGRPLHAGPAEAGRDGHDPRDTRGRQRLPGDDEEGRGHPPGDDVRLAPRSAVASRGTEGRR